MFQGEFVHESYTRIAILDLADAYLQKHEEHRLSVRKRSLAALPKLITARRNLLHGIIALKQRVEGVSYEHKDGRMHLIAQFIQGVDLAFLAIVDGLYAQAAALQKQQLEAIAALGEYTAGIRENGKTPNIKNSGQRGFGRMYGELNDIAHPSNDHILESLCHFEEEGKQGPTTKPQFVEEYCRYFLSNHCLQLLNLWRHMSYIYRDEFGLPFPKEDDQSISAAMIALMELGYLGYDGGET